MAYQGNVISKGALRDWMLQNNRQKEGQSTWQSMYNEVNQQASSQQQAIADAYNESVLQAYDSYLSNKAAIAGSNIIGSGKSTLQKSAQQQLDEAYLTYASNAYESATAVTESQQEALNAITAELDTQAGNYSSYLNKTYDYLTYLWENRDTIDGAIELFENPNWSKYLVDVTDESGTSTGEQRLLAKDELFNPHQDDNNEWLSVFDNEGELTLRGQDYFDQMLNHQDLSFSFNDWLLENDEELYDWARSESMYDVTTAGSNLGSLKRAVGLDSTDFDYRFTERFGGLTTNEKQAIVNDFENVNNNLSRITSLSVDNPDDVKEITRLTDESVESMKQTLRTLGLLTEFEKATGYNLDELSSQMHELYTNSMSDKDVNKYWWRKNFLPFTLSSDERNMNITKHNREQATKAIEQYQAFTNALKQFMSKQTNQYFNI